MSILQSHQKREARDEGTLIKRSTRHANVVCCTRSRLATDTGLRLWSLLSCARHRGGLHPPHSRHCNCARPICISSVCFQFGCHARHALCEPTQGAGAQGGAGWWSVGSLTYRTCCRGCACWHRTATGWVWLSECWEQVTPLTTQHPPLPQSMEAGHLLWRSQWVTSRRPLS
jgi:hypothetical protein